VKQCEQQQQTDWARTWPGGEEKVLPLFFTLSLALSSWFLALGPFGCFCCGFGRLAISLQHFVRGSLAFLSLSLSRFLSFAKEAGAGYPKGCIPSQSGAQS